MPVMSKVSVPSSLSEAADSPSGNCSGMTPMPIRLERWMRSNDSVMTARTPSRLVPLAAQSREEPEPYSLPPSTTSGMSGGRVVLCGVVDEGLLAAVGEVAGVAAGHIVEQLVAQPDVGEGAADHHFVVTAP